MKTGLVLEGGGMRGLYTAGVLDLFLKETIEFNYVIGVSAGACNAASYISKQYDRNRRVYVDYIGDKRYLSFHNFVKTGSIFGMDFIFDEIPNHLEIFDYDAFFNSPSEFITGVTDVLTGRPVYFSKEKLSCNCVILKASSSIPVFSPIAEFDGGKYLDGGTSDPIPVKKALDDGCDKLVVVLTRNRGYQKNPESFKLVYHRMYHKYPEMIKVLDERHKIYNETLKSISELEAQGRVMVLAPKSPLKVGRFEKRSAKLQELYQQGFDEAQDITQKIKDFLSQDSV